MRERVIKWLEKASGLECQELCLELLHGLEIPLGIGSDRSIDSGVCKGVAEKVKARTVVEAGTKFVSLIEERLELLKMTCNRVSLVVEADFCESIVESREINLFGSLVTLTVEIVKLLPRCTKCMLIELRSNNVENFFGEGGRENVVARFNFAVPLFDALFSVRDPELVVKVIHDSLVTHAFDLDATLAKFSHFSMSVVNFIDRCKSAVSWSGIEDVAF